MLEILDPVAEFQIARSGDQSACLFLDLSHLRAFDWPSQTIAQLGAKSWPAKCNDIDRST
jgi:hypothetical protein